VQALATAARLRDGVPGGGRSDTPRLDDVSLAGIFSVMQEQANWLASLQDVLRRDTRDLAILEEASSKKMEL
jgi:hypothetical protein